MQNFIRDDWSKEEKLFYRRTVQIVEEIRDQMPNGYITKDQIDHFLRNIVRMIEIDDLDNPSASHYFPDLFSYIGSGSFKECYHSDLPGWIIKFYSSENPTASELNLLELIQDRPAAPLFLKTYTVEMPRSIRPPSFNIDPIDGLVVISGFMLQPLVTSAVNYNQERGFEPINKFLSEESYSKTPLKLNTLDEISYKEYQETLNHLDIYWMQGVIDTYGDEVFYDFIEIMLEHQVNDLHGGNLGYLESTNGDEPYPIILDWMSNC